MMKSKRNNTKIKFIINKFKDTWVKNSVLIICVFLIIGVLKLSIQLLRTKIEGKQFITTVLATLLGGILSIILTLIINNNQYKEKAILKRKEDIYIPLYEELKKLQLDLNDNNLDYNFETKVVENIINSYKKDTISKRIISLLEKFIEIRSRYNNINHIIIAKHVIIDNFILGFTDLYGSHIEGVCKVTNYDGTTQYVEEEYEEVQRIRRISDEEARKILQYKYSSERERALVELYNSFIIDDKEILIKLPEADYAEYGQELSKGEYIVDKYSFDKKFLKEEQIIKKHELRQRLITIIHEWNNELQYILVDIYNKYEKYRY